jgi:predicted anti-sigma-YlaC factor YlaD
MSSTIEILRNANRLVLDQLDAADERVKAKENEARQILDACVNKRENIKRKRQIIQEIERVQLDSLAEIEDAEVFVGDTQERSTGTDATAPARIADRLAFAVVKASQAGGQIKR